jgi:DNA-binding NtrC family response regulator
MRVLLVDDEEQLASALAERLCLRGMDAVWATSAEEALAASEAHEFDIALLDIKMPGMGGVELKQRLSEKWPAMKFIFVTGHGSKNELSCPSCEHPGCEVLGKPLDIDNLIEQMKKMLGIQP